MSALPEKTLLEPVMTRQRIEESASSCFTAEANSFTNSGQRALKASGRSSSTRPTWRSKPLRDTFSPLDCVDAEINRSPVCETPRTIRSIAYGARKKRFGMRFVMTFERSFAPTATRYSLLSNAVLYGNPRACSLLSNTEHGLTWVFQKPVNAAPPDGECKFK